MSGRAALVGWFDCATQDVEEMNEWLAREHFPERLAVPGFLRGRRFRSRDGRPEFFVMYEIDTIAALSSEVYLERLDNPTRLTRKIAPRLSGTRRTACRITATAGETDGGTVATLEVEQGPTAAHELRAHLAERFRGLVVRPGVFCAHLLEPDYGISGIETVEKGLRVEPDRMTNWVVMVEGRDEPAIRRAATELLAADDLIALGADAVDELNVFTLDFAATRRDSRTDSPVALPQ